jgi:hypothetical protein
MTFGLGSRGSYMWVEELPPPRQQCRRDWTSRYSGRSTHSSTSAALVSAKSGSPPGAVWRRVRHRWNIRGRPLVFGRWGEGD